MEINRNMSYLKGTVMHIGSILFLFILAACPYVFVQLEEGIHFNLSTILIVIKQFINGLFSGDSFYYIQGDRTRFILSDMGSYFLGSFFYLFVVGLAVLILGIWLWRGSERFLLLLFYGVF